MTAMPSNPYIKAADKAAAKAAEKAARGLTGTPWEERFTRVQQDILRAFSADDCDLIATARRHQTDPDVSTALIDPDAFIRELGLGQPRTKKDASGNVVPPTDLDYAKAHTRAKKHLRERLRPPTGVGPHPQPGPDDDILCNEVSLYLDAEGELDYARVITEPGTDVPTVRWLVNLRPIVEIPVLDAAGQPVLKDGKPKMRPETAADYWIPWMTSWTSEHPINTENNSQWVRRTDVTSGMRWVTAVLMAQAMLDASSARRRGDTTRRSSHGTDKSAVSLSKDWGLGLRSVQAHIAAAEDAGMVTVVGPRRGKVAPFRRGHRIPVDAAKRTGETRVKSTAPAESTARALHVVPQRTDDEYEAMLAADNPPY